MEMFSPTLGQVGLKMSILGYSTSVFLLQFGKSTFSLLQVFSGSINARGVTHHVTGVTLGGGGPWNPESLGEIGEPLFQLPMHLLCISHPLCIVHRVTEKMMDSNIMDTENVVWFT